jgi:hypothetical protein
MNIKAGDRIADLSELCTGKVRAISYVRGKRWVIVDLPNLVIRMVKYDQVNYNDELKVWEVIGD